ncbi:MAG: biosynthetic arginine decarboxylase [Deltaproteobacteria bacterium]|nr:biosynthetic arginine decarboxylase [Deltaproteobacteria bacterium]
MTKKSNRSKSTWSAKKSDAHYNVSGWGEPYFSINPKGNVLVHPTGQKKRKVDLKELVDQLTERGIQTPLLVRFNDIITHRIKTISDAFKNAANEFGYAGQASVIFPIKVNQQRHVVEQIAAQCKTYGVGLEAGSKPELLAVLALSQDSNTPVVCNGYKDEEYFQMALMGRKMGKRVLPVIEKFSEFETLIKTAKDLKIMPEFGVRIKLSTTGAGKWQSSTGHRSKFGLTVTEMLRGFELLKKKRMHKGLKLLHFHQGSQITNIATLKKSLKEAGRVYVELRKLGAGLEILDVGGGLGVDYNGSNSNQDSSMNYTVEEYARDVVFQIKDICDAEKVPHPDIFTECGRAVVAHHAVLVYDVLGISGFDRHELPAQLPQNAPKPLSELSEIKTAITRSSKNVLENYHDAIATFQECQNLFNLGFMSLKDRGLAEEFYFSILKRSLTILKKEDEYPEIIKKLEETLPDTYFANFSVFQSLPDHWAIDQQFPIIPIQRLNEEPSRSAVIADITCDSDGKVDQFIDPKEDKRILNLHPHNEDESYYLATFLVGAYQETLGDLHNLFGDTNAVHITMDKKGNPIVETVVRGDTVKEVLSYVQYDLEDLMDRLHKQIENAVHQERINFKESGEFLKFYEQAMEGYTYLEDWEAKEEF